MVVGLSTASVTGHVFCFSSSDSLLLPCLVAGWVQLKFKRKENSLTSHLVRLMSMVIYFLINIALTYSFRIYTEVRRLPHPTQPLL
jgi:hypothetical protein